jgi:hypothetical protein
LSRRKQHVPSHIQDVRPWYDADAEPLRHLTVRVPARGSAHKLTILITESSSNALPVKKFTPVQVPSLVPKRSVTLDGIPLLRGTVSRRHYSAVPPAHGNIPPMRSFATRSQHDGNTATNEADLKGLSQRELRALVAAASSIDERLVQSVFLTTRRRGSRIASASRRAYRGTSSRAVRCSRRGGSAPRSSSLG